MRGKLLLSALGVLTAGLLAVACSGASAATDDKVAALTQELTALKQNVQGTQAKSGKIGLASGERTFYVTGVEWKGSTTTKSLAAPPIDPATLSDGYGFKKPGDADKADATKWEVSAYVWSPGDMVMLQGDKANLQFFIVNGNKHSVHVEGPDGTEVVKEMEMNRGREYSVSFTPAQPGVYKLICTEHEPTMTTGILVLPRG